LSLLCITHIYTTREIKTQSCRATCKILQEYKFRLDLSVDSATDPDLNPLDGICEVRVRIFERGRGGGPPCFGVRLGQLDHPRWVRFPRGFERQCVCAILDIIYVAVYIYSIYYTVH
jgi:hypothetical protein